MSADKNFADAESKQRTEGAEFLVLGNLLIRGVHANKAQTKYPGWDVFALNLDSNKPVRIQVKSKVWLENLTFSVINNDFDFIALVRLNQISQHAEPSETRVGTPQYWIIPKEDLESEFTNLKTKSPTSEVKFSLSQLPKIPDFYENNWNLIIKFLNH